MLEVDCRHDAMSRDARNVLLPRNEHFIELDDRLNICVIWHVALEHFRVGHEGSEKVLNRIKEVMAHCDVCRFCPWNRATNAMLDRYSLEAWMSAQEFDGHGHVGFSVVRKVKP
jgi:hypothetical protein